MNTLQTHIDHYLTYCRCQKRLDEKTLKAYRIDLTQFLSQISCSTPAEINSAILEDFIVKLHKNYKPKTVKRKIASLKTLFHYLEYREKIRSGTSLSSNFFCHRNADFETVRFESQRCESLRQKCPHLWQGRKRKADTFSPIKRAGPCWTSPSAG